MSSNTSTSAAANVGAAATGGSGTGPAAVPVVIAPANAAAAAVSKRKGLSPRQIAALKSVARAEEAASWVAPARAAVDAASMRAMVSDPRNMNARNARNSAFFNYMEARRRANAAAASAKKQAKTRGKAMKGGRSTRKMRGRK